MSEDRESQKSQSESLVLLASTILACLLSPLHLSANASTVGQDRLFIGLIPTGTILAALGPQDDHDCQQIWPQRYLLPPEHPCLLPTTESAHIGVDDLVASLHPRHTFPNSL